MLVKVLVPGYFAQKDTKTPVRIGIIAFVSNAVLNLILIWYLRHIGLALATSISAFLNAALLYSGLKQRGLVQLTDGWPLLLLRIVVATVLMIAGLAILNPEPAAWYDLSFWIRLSVLLAICGAGLLMYLISLVLIGFRLDAVRA